MAVNALLGATAKVVAQARTEYNDDEELAIDFGTPNDIYLPAHLAGEYHNARVLIFMSADAGSGTNDELTVKLYDADDNNGAFGTPDELTAAPGSGVVVAEGVDWDHAPGLGPEGATGNRNIVMSVRPRPGRPWLRVSLLADGDTDTFVVHTTVLALKPGV